nr:transcriptional repressor LexA [Oceanococcus sp. HetDA_MAG_MS8]
MNDSARPSLTARQTQVLDMIRQHLQRHGVPPTQADIAQALGFASQTAAKDHLRALARKGYVDWRPGVARGIRLSDPLPADEPADFLELPVIGRVAAGSPLLAVEHVDTHYRIDARLFQPQADYLLRVRGWSMRDAGIHEDDLLAVHRSQQLRPGQMGVIRVDDEVTVKYWRPQADRVELHPDNPDFDVIVVDPQRQHLAIEGLAVGVIRPWNTEPASVEP